MAGQAFTGVVEVALDRAGGGVQERGDLIDRQIEQIEKANRKTLLLWQHPHRISEIDVRWGQLHHRRCRHSGHGVLAPFVAARLVDQPIDGDASDPCRRHIHVGNLSPSKVGLHECLLHGVGRPLRATGHGKRTHQRRVVRPEEALESELFDHDVCGHRGIHDGEGRQVGLISRILFMPTRLRHVGGRFHPGLFGTLLLSSIVTSLAACGATGGTSNVTASNPRETSTPSTAGGVARQLTPRVNDANGETDPNKNETSPEGARPEKLPLDTMWAFRSEHLVTCNGPNTPLSITVGVDPATPREVRLDGNLISTSGAKADEYDDAALPCDGRSHTLTLRLGTGADAVSISHQLPTTPAPAPPQDSAQPRLANLSIDHEVRRCPFNDPVALLYESEYAETMSVEIDGIKIDQPTPSGSATISLDIPCTPPTQVLSLVLTGSTGTLRNNHTLVRVPAA